jgi:hypothetical protein
MLIEILRFFWAKEILLNVAYAGKLLWVEIIKPINTLLPKKRKERRERGRKEGKKKERNRGKERRKRERQRDRKKERKRERKRYP